MMPQMSGAEFYRALQRMDQRYEARVTFMTGGAFTTSARQFLDAIPNRTLEKPFTREQLLALMSEPRG